MCVALLMPRRIIAHRLHGRTAPTFAGLGSGVSGLENDLRSIYMRKNYRVTAFALQVERFSASRR
jgi:hypothetical protein